MNSRLSGAAVLAVAGCLWGCSGDSIEFIIVQNQVPSSGCVVGVERQIYRGEGWLDLALVGDGAPFAYQLYPLLLNDLPALGEAAGEPNRVFVRGFRVQVELAGDQVPRRMAEVFEAEQNQPLLEFQERWAGRVDPGGGLISASVAVIPGELARKMRETRVLETTLFVPLTVRVRAIGERSDGTVETPEFRFPLRVCQGCLVANLRPCPYAAMNRGHACNIAQDVPVDCCTEGNALFCPAQAGPVAF